MCRVAPRAGISKKHSWRRDTAERGRRCFLMARACHLAWPIRSRIGVIRCSQSFEYQSCGASEKFTEFQLMMIEADSVLRPGIEAMPGLINYYAGADEANSSLTNVSIWKTLDNAKQMDTFQPML